MLKLEMQKLDGKSYLQVTCECDEVKSSSISSSSPQHMASKQNEVSVTIEVHASFSNSEEPEIPQLSLKLYTFKDFIIVESRDGDFLIYRDGNFQSGESSLDSALNWIEYLLAEQPSPSH